MWKEQYEKYRMELLRYAIGVTHDKARAEDLVQETFLRALQSTDVYEELGSSQRRAWLYRTLKNLICDAHRDTVAQMRFENQELAAEDREEPGFAQMENAMLLQALPPEDRALFVMRYLEGYNAAELSEMFNLPSGTIRSRLSRSRRLLRGILEEK